MHRTIEQVLSTYMQSDEAHWENLSPAAEPAYSYTVHGSTGLTPFEVMIGEHPLRACDLDLADTLQPTTTPPMTKVVHQLMDRAAKHIQLAQAPQKSYADQARREVGYTVGDKVWISTNFMQPRGVAKLQSRFVGPFRALSCVRKVAHKLALPPSMQHQPALHVALLRRDRPRPDMLQPQRWQPVAIDHTDKDPRYEVEHSLDVRRSGDKKEFLAK